MPRKLCTTCKRPPNVCYCSHLVSIDNNIEVLIIQHPREQNHPYNTGRIAHLCLNNSQLVTSAGLSKHRLAALLGEKSALLYPTLTWMSNAPEIEFGNDGPTDDIEQLVVIDATWRKSKRLLYEHTSLQLLPRVSLKAVNPSTYRVRKASVDNGLSTIESIAATLQLLEANSTELLKPFERMVELELSYR